MSNRVKKPKAKVAHAANRRLPGGTIADKYDLNQDGPVTANGQQPSLMEAVREIHRYQKRNSYVQKLAKLYECSVRTVDRAIAECEKEWLEEINQDRPKRVAKKNAILMRLAQKSERASDFRGAALAVRESNRMLGDEAPKKIQVALPQAGLSPEEQMEEAERIRKLFGG